MRLTWIRFSFICYFDYFVLILWSLFFIFSNDYIWLWYSLLFMSILLSMILYLMLNLSFSIFWNHWLVLILFLILFIRLDNYCSSLFSKFLWLLFARWSQWLFLYFEFYWLYILTLFIYKELVKIPNIFISWCLAYYIR